ncbi:MAG TPA: TRAP transporter small permease [Albitalea sp.]|nr:TRAP transporter small permease [Albitalea sp.]
MDHPYIRCMDRLYLGCVWFAGAAIVMMSIIIPVGVFMRYAMGFGAQWPEPIAILLMVIFTFVGAAASYRAGAHIAVSLMTETLPTRLRRLCERLTDLLMIGLCVFVAYYGARLCGETWNQSISELPWLPVGVTYAPLPLGAAATLLFIIERMVFGSQSHRAIVRYEEQLVEAHAAPTAMAEPEARAA